MFPLSPRWCRCTCHGGPTRRCLISSWPPLIDFTCGPGRVGSSDSRSTPDRWPSGPILKDLWSSLVGITPLTFSFTFVYNNYILFFEKEVKTKLLNLCKNKCVYSKKSNVVDNETNLLIKIHIHVC